MSLCTHCRMALRHSLRHKPGPQRARLSTAPSSSSLLSTPTWSIRSLLSPPSSQPFETITPTQLHHLLRLSALPLPESKADEDSMIATLQSQLHFVRAVQRVDTRGVEPLRAIRDETDAATRESAVSLGDLREALERETLVGHYKRPKRVEAVVKSEAEGWDVLSTASRKAGKYFVVESGSKDTGES